jgi:hypothetical protein
VLDVLSQSLKPHSARAFHDRCLPEVARDASQVQWIATANEAERIPRALRSRLREFRIPPLTTAQPRTIIANLDTELRKALRLKGVQPLPEDMLQQLATLSPRRAKQALRELFGLVLVRGEGRCGVDAYPAARGGPARRRSRSMNRYRLSTFSRAQGVLRKTFRLDPMLGSLLKQRRAMRCARPSQP